MKRLIEENLLQWKTSSRRKPLIVRGARQVGKTFTIKKFSADHFQNNAIHIDFEKNRAVHKVFSGDLDAAHIISQLELFLNKKIIPGSTLLFLDEIQACPNALTALRYFYEEAPALHVMAAGSLLDFALEEMSFPVGRVQFMEMNPMSFAEFLYATGGDNLAELVRKPPAVQPEAIHETLLKAIRNYFIVGGMPEAVAAYASTGSLFDSLAVHHELVESYMNDFSKYGVRVDRECLETVFRSVARSVGNQLKYTRLAEGHSGHTIKKAFQLLMRARVITPVYAASASGLPLGALKDASAFKAIMVDLGLMHALCGLNAAEECSRDKLLSAYSGALAEQFVGQELRTTQSGGLYYWSRQEKNSSAEVDYLSVTDGVIHPVEVKSGPEGRLRSLHLLLKSIPDCGNGIVLNEGVYGRLASGRLEFVPLYYTASATGGFHK